MPKVFVLLRDSSHPNICWRSGKVSCRQPWRLLECMGDNFLLPAQAIDYQRGSITGSIGHQCKCHSLGTAGITLGMDEERSKAGLLNLGKQTSSSLEG